MAPLTAPRLLPLVAAAAACIFRQGSALHGFSGAAVEPAAAADSLQHQALEADLKALEDAADDFTQPPGHGASQLQQSSRPARAARPQLVQSGSEGWKSKAEDDLAALEDAVKSFAPSQRHITSALQGGLEAELKQSSSKAPTHATAAVRQGHSAQKHSAPPASATASQPGNKGSFMQKAEDDLKALEDAANEFAPPQRSSSPVAAPPLVKAVHRATTQLRQSSSRVPHLSHGGVSQLQQASKGAVHAALHMHAAAHEAPASEALLITAQVMQTPQPSATQPAVPETSTPQPVPAAPAAAQPPQPTASAPVVVPSPLKASEEVPPSAPAAVAVAQAAPKFVAAQPVALQPAQQPAQQPSASASSSVLATAAGNTPAPVKTESFVSVHPKLIAFVLILAASAGLMAWRHQQLIYEAMAAKAAREALRLEQEEQRRAAQVWKRPVYRKSVPLNLQDKSGGQSTGKGRLFLGASGSA